MNLEHATLTPVVDDKLGEPQKVQFNPSSLRIQRSHNATLPHDAKPTAQTTGAPVTLAFDLHFDTADQGTTQTPVNVRTWTAQIAQYLDTGSDEKQKPPEACFAWGTEAFTGAVTSMSEDLDLFAPNGVPLRAKVSISMNVKDPMRQRGKTGPGSGTGTGATAPGGGAFGALGGVGLGMSASFGAPVGGHPALPRLRVGGGGSVSIGLGASASGGFGTPAVGIALDGESPAAFAARMGLDPAAWRALAVAGGVELSLAAGTEIAFPRGISTAPGAGTASGGAGATGATAAARAALDRVDGAASAAPARGSAAPARALAGGSAVSGIALAGAGGVDAALQAVRQERADAASALERQAFGLPTPPPVVAPAFGSSRTRAGGAGSAGSTGSAGSAGSAGGAGASAAGQAAGGSASAAAGSPRAGLGAPGRGPAARPRADERATTYGRGVPLRPRSPFARASGGPPVLGRRSPVAAPAPAAPVPRPGGDCGCGCGGHP